MAFCHRFRCSGRSVREQRIGAYTYVYLVASTWSRTSAKGGRTKRRIIKSPGPKEAVAAGGDLDRLARSAARPAPRSMILSLLDGGTVPEVSCLRIGPPPLFERPWRASACRSVVETLAGGRAWSPAAA